MIGDSYMGRYNLDVLGFYLSIHIKDSTGDTEKGQISEAAWLASKLQTE